jgi:hypothetical protein
MSKPGQPYQLSSGGTVGSTVSKALAQVGTAISDGISAVSGVKKHAQGLAHLTEQAELERAHEKEVIGIHHNNAKELVTHLNTEGGYAAERKQDMEFEHTPGGATKFKLQAHPAVSAAQHETTAEGVGEKVGEALGAAAGAAATKNPAGAAAGAAAGKALGGAAGRGVAKAAKIIKNTGQAKAAAKSENPKPPAAKKPASPKKGK